jgi:tetratricopeptide (TPR) repeat protein
MSVPKFRNIPKPSKVTRSSQSVQQLFEKALDWHVKNQFDLALPLYEQVLSLQPNHFDALHYLGVVHYQRGNAEQALALITKALSLDPRHSICRGNLANVFKSLGRAEDAFNSYQVAIELNPQFSDAYFNLGVVSSELGNINEAIVRYSQSISIKPKFPAAYSNRGLLLQQIGLSEKACSDYEQATNLDPNYAQAFFNWGVAMQDRKGLENLQQALKLYDKALAIDPGLFMALNNRGNVLQELGDFQQAFASFSKAIDLNPQFHQAFYNRGALLQELKQFDSALKDYDAAIDLDRNMKQAYFNRGSVQEQRMYFMEAKNDFETAIALDHNFANAYFNLALLTLKLEQFNEGWSLYEWRWNSDDFLGFHLTSSRKKIPLNQFKLKDITGLRVMLWNEQGVGDDVFFMPWVQKMWSHSLVEKFEVICRVEKRLLPLFRRSFPNLQFTGHQTQVPEDQYDLHLPIGSLPHLMDQIESKYSDQYQSTQAYLKADKEVSNNIRLGLKKSPKRVLIGISWRSKNPKTGAPRSIDLLKLVRTLNFPNVDFVNLQYGEVKDDIKNVLDQTGIVVHEYPGLDVGKDLDGLANIISACDAVVSVDNTTVHLSGALGVHTYVMLPLIADWRWGLNRNKALWYPNVELFRQLDRGNWDGVLEEIREVIKSRGEITNLSDF